MNDLILQQPRPEAGTARQLFLLFHGVGSNAEDLRGLGNALAARHPEAWVVSVQSPEPSDLGQGWQWFSVRGVTTDNRAYRIATAMPGFIQTVARWQQRSGVGAQGTTLLGFSQGAIMALESTQEPLPVAGRVVALAGLFAAPPHRAHPGTRIHLLHGQVDGVVPALASVEAQAQLAALQADVTLDLLAGLGHGIDERMAARLWDRLAAAH
ncbi:MAG: esterase [Burkholderiales bacterium]|nr:esterase [Burkholderiales bacterium]